MHGPLNVKKVDEISIKFYIKRFYWNLSAQSSFDSDQNQVLSKSERYAFLLSGTQLIRWQTKRRTFYLSVNSIRENLGPAVLTVSRVIFSFSRYQRRSPSDTFINHPGRTPCKTTPERACCILYNMGSFHII